MSTDLNAARDRLNEERARLLAEAAALQADLSHSIEDSFDEDGNDSHLADSATETVEREIEQSLEENAEHLLAEIDAALGRLDAGTYGSCVRCDKPVGDDRLSALPYAAKCIECKRLEERG